MIQTNQKKRSSVQNSDSILEQLRDAGSKDSIFSPKKADIKQNEEFNFNPFESLPQKELPQIKQPEVVLFSAEEVNLNREVEAVRVELKKAVVEIKELNTAVLEVEKAISQVPVKKGRYYLSFFSFLKRLLIAFRKQVSDSKLWLEASVNRKSKKKQKGYWSMFKKHGTSFGLSNERAIATQAG